jgi:regulator of sigma E protease
MIASTIIAAQIFKLIIFLFVLGVLVAFHELGHFLFAKLFNVGVIEFAVGFGPKLLTRKFGETVYSLRAIPLGGFVRMVGDDPRAVAKGVGGEGEAPEDEPCQDHNSIEYQNMVNDESRWFLKQKFWPKFLIVFAGPAFNLILAFLLSFGGQLIFGISEPVDEPIVGEVVEGLPAEKAGIRSGDRIIAVDEVKPKTWVEMATVIAERAGRGVNLIVQRGDEEITFNVQGKLSDAEESQVTNQPQRYQVGIIVDGRIRPVGVGEAFINAGTEIVVLTKLTILGMVRMISGYVSPKNIRGPLFIFNKAGEFAEKGIYPLFRFMMFLSISLAVLNLLPVPVLDGGHLMIFLLEACIRRPLSLAAQERASQVGMVLLLLLMVFAVGNDLSSMMAG